MAGTNGRKAIKDIGTGNKLTCWPLAGKRSIDNNGRLYYNSNGRLYGIHDK
jgi:hypothetical protein